MPRITVEISTKPCPAISMASFVLDSDWGLASMILPAEFIPPEVERLRSIPIDDGALGVRWEISSFRSLDSERSHQETVFTGANCGNTFMAPNCRSTSIQKKKCAAKQVRAHFNRFCRRQCLLAANSCLSHTAAGSFVLPHSSRSHDRYRCANFSFVT